MRTSTKSMEVLLTSKITSRKMSLRSIETPKKSKKRTKYPKASVPMVDLAQ